MDGAADLPDGYLEVHTFSVDSAGNLYGGDNQYGRTQKFVPKKGADPAHLIKAPWVERGAERQRVRNSANERHAPVVDSINRPGTEISSSGMPQ